MTAAPSGRWPVAVLGATGAVGQTFIRLLAAHPWFTVAEVAASERSAGQVYSEVTRWLEGAMPDRIAPMRVLPCDPAKITSPIVFSALDSAAAGEIEPMFAGAGRIVLSNAKNFRMADDVPLVIPEVNGDHLALIATQREHRGWTGAIVTNANCAATVAAVALAPLHEAFGLKTVFAATMQAVSGAGYPGVASLDVLGNVIPYIAEEEGKIERELPKMLGRFANGRVTPAEFIVSAHANRVPVEHGHTVVMSCGFMNRPTPDAAMDALRTWRGRAEARELPSAPAAPLFVDASLDRPQPRRDVNRGGGMTVTVGRVRADTVLDLRLVALGHNTIRGAAGGSILNAELLAATGVIPPHMIVCKYGGTSVADAEAIRRAATGVRGRLARHPIVVVSALAGVTNALLAIAEQASTGQIILAGRGVEALRERHLQECATLLGPGSHTVVGEIGGLFDELAALAQALNTLGHVTPRSLDAIAAIGERCASLLVVAAFLKMDLPAEHVDARLVVKTDAHFTRAEPRPDAIAFAARERIMPLVKAGKVPVMGGFVGSTDQGITTTLGRGGGDYSAALLGAAVQAEAIEIWTDVDGMMTADPRVVPAARPIEEIRFEEASELASFGAKVLHPSTIAPAVKLGIPVFIFNSRRPEARGTRITFDAPARSVTAIAGRGGVSILRIRSTRMLLAPGFLSEIFETFARHRTSVDVVATSEVSVSVTVDDVSHVEDLLNDLSKLGDVSVERNRAIVAVVGSDLSATSRAMARALTALDDCRVHMVSLSATGINLTILVDGDALGEAMRRLHAAFFEDAA